MLRNVDIIVLINVLRQLTLSGCSHICKRLSRNNCVNCTNLVRKYKKNTPKGALYKYSNSFELTFTKLDALRAFLRPGFLRSTLRESRVRSPARFNESRSLGSEEGHERYRDG